MNFSLKLIIIIQAVAVLTIFLDIPIVRQIIGFIYISFLPGFLILRVFKLNFKSFFEELPFSIGLSIAFSMLVGFLINILYPFFGISEPLSTLPIMITICVILLVLTFVIGRRQVITIKLGNLPSLKQLLFFSLLAAVLLLSIFGAMYHNSFALFMMVEAIAVLVTLTIFFRKSLPVYFFPIVIVVIALSINFQRELISPYLIGYDTFGEYYVFSSASTHSFWNANLLLSQPELRDYNSMLSVTILPVLYSRLMNVSGEFVFKILYFILYAFVPLAMFQMYKQNFGKETAFLSAFYFILSLDSMEKNADKLWELFLVLLLFTIISNNISLKKKKLLIGSWSFVGRFPLLYF